jgi:hypothetical protein
MDFANKADQYATANGIDSTYFRNGSPSTTTSCFGSPDGLPDGVQIDVQTAGATFFSSLWGVVAPDVGAHAKVCLGSPQDATTTKATAAQPSSGSALMPFALAADGDQNGGQDANNPYTNCFPPGGKPRFSVACQIPLSIVTKGEGDSGDQQGNHQGGNNANGGGDRVQLAPGVLRLDNNNGTNCSSRSAGELIETEIANGGAKTTCAIAPGTNSGSCPYLAPDNIGKCVWHEQGDEGGGGNNATGDVNETLRGLYQWLSKEGQASAPYNCHKLSGNGGGSDAPPSMSDGGNALYIVGHDAGNNPIYQRKACTSPRLITIPIVDTFTDGNNKQDDDWFSSPYVIRGFAGFWITGCTRAASRSESPETDAQCNLSTDDSSGRVTLDGQLINYVDVGQRGGAWSFGRMNLYLVE